MDRAMVPQGVGTSIFAPWAASASVTGTRTSSRLPLRRKNGCGLTWMVTRMSPAGAPPAPGSPWPRTRIRLPSSMPAGILIVMVSRWPSAALDGDGRFAATDRGGKGDGHFMLQIGPAGRVGGPSSAATAAATKLLEQIRESTNAFLSARAAEHIVQIKRIRLRAGRIGPAAPPGPAGPPAPAKWGSAVPNWSKFLRFSASPRISNAFCTS